MEGKFFFEQEEEGKKGFYKLFAAVAMVATFVAGVVLYIVLTSEAERNPILMEARCGFEPVRTFQIGAPPKDFGGVQRMIEFEVNAANNSLRYLDLKPTLECDNEVGMWFSSRDGGSMYVYCIGKSSGKLVAFNRAACERVDHAEAVSTAVESFRDAAKTDVTK